MVIKWIFFFSAKPETKIITMNTSISSTQENNKNIPKSNFRSRKRLISDQNSTDSFGSSCCIPSSSRNSSRRQRRECDTIPITASNSNLDYQCFFNESFTYVKPIVISTDSTRDLQHSSSFLDGNATDHDWFDVHPQLCTNLSELSAGSTNSQVRRGEYINEIFRESENLGKDDNSRDDAHQRQPYFTMFRS